MRKVVCARVKDLLVQVFDRRFARSAAWPGAARTELRIDLPKEGLFEGPTLEGREGKPQEGISTAPRLQGLFRDSIAGKPQLWSDQTA